MSTEIFKTPLLLASASPRRKYLLEEAGFTVRVHPSDIEEEYPATLPVDTIATYLADLKGMAVLNQKSETEIILAADTIVVLDNEVIGKPATRERAIYMLGKLSGNTHTVHTGVCLIDQFRKVLFQASSTVTFGHLSPWEIEYYIDTFKPFDKAGGYGIQEWIGWCKVEKICGSYSNIIGLPMERVYRELIEFRTNGSKVW